MAVPEKMIRKVSDPNSYYRKFMGRGPKIEVSSADEPNFNLLTPVSPSKGKEILNGRVLRSNSLLYDSVDRSAEDVVGCSKKTLCSKENKSSLLSSVEFVKSGQKNVPKGKSENVDLPEIKCENVYYRKRKVDGTRAHATHLEKTKFCFNTEGITKPSIAVPKVDVLSTLRNKLSERQLQLFSNTYFGIFLHFPQVTMQPQLIHSLLLREVVQENNDELWLSVNDVLIRFGIGEFAVMTGLKCNGVPHKRYDGMSKNSLVDRCFSGIEKLNVQAIVDCFESQRWTNDQDALKIAVLYFIHTFLLSTLHDNKVSIGHFELVETGEFETYPWGRLSYDETFSSLKNALRGKSGKKYTRLYGFPLEFQTWFYESCQQANEELAIFIEKRVPRILSWKVLRNPNSKDVSKILSDRKLKLRSIYPTTIEKSLLHLSEFFDYKTHVADGDDVAVKSSDSSFTSPPPVLTRKRSKQTAEAPEHHVVLIREIKRISEAQLDLKEEFHTEEVKFLKQFMEESNSNIMMSIESLSNIQSGINLNEINGGSGHREGNGDAGIDRIKENRTKGNHLDRHLGDDMCAEDKSEKLNKAATNEDPGEDWYIDVPESQITPYTNPGAYFNRENVTNCDQGRKDMESTKDKSVKVNDFAKNKDPVEDIWIDVPESQIILYTNEITPNVTAREKRPAQVLMSPYLNDFGSDFLDRTFLKGKHPFERFIPDESEKTGIHNKKAYRLGVLLVDRKEWFHPLAYAGQPMSNTHIDVIFYYLRKKGNYENDLPEKFTTTDPFFGSELEQLYQDYLADNDSSLISPMHICAEYVLGNEIESNSPWHTVSHFLFPICVDRKSHWILARLSFHERCIYVYDFKRGAAYNVKVRKAVLPYSVVIPYFLCVLGFYGKRNDIDWSTGPYKNKNVVEPFDINFVDGLPVQKKPDCGVYVAAFAEYFIEGSGKPDEDFEVHQHRTRFGALLWYYGKMKQDQDIVSDAEHYDQ